MRTLAGVGGLLAYLAVVAWLLPDVALDALAVGAWLLVVTGAVLAFGERVRA